MLRTLLTTAALLLVGGCSLIIDDVTVQTCSSDEDCLVFNTIEHVEESCRPFACVEGSCLRRAEGEEICDGFDNDCDGLIDEPSRDAEGRAIQTVIPVVLQTTSGATDVSSVSYGVGPSGGLGFSWVSESSAWYVDGTTEDEPHPVEMGYSCDPAGQDAEGDALVDGCSEQGSLGPSPTSCNFADVAMAISNERALVASISAEGCVQGQLRIGFFERESSPDVILRGPLRRSNSFLGIDLVDELTNVCTGGSRPECLADEESCGAARPSLAVLEEEGDTIQAFVAWIGADMARRQCGGQEANVEFLAAHLVTRHVSTTDSVEWVTASNEAVPQLLGRTRAGGRPAVTAWGARGYFVAYGDGDGRIALHFVPRADDPTNCRDTPCNTENCDLWTCLGDLEPDDRSGLETGPVEGVVTMEAIEVAEANEVNDVALAVGSIREGGVELGIAWRSGCDAEAGSIAFSQVKVRLDGVVPNGQLDASPSVLLTEPEEDGQRRGPPAITYSPSGFVTEGFSRADTTAGPDTVGGWTVAWSSAERVVARRLLELDGAPIDEDELIEISPSTSEAQLPGLFTTTDGAPSIRFIYHDSKDDTFNVGRMTCEPMHTR